MDFSGLIASYRPPSAIEEDVVDSMHRDERSRNPMRHLADCIIRGSPLHYVRGLIEEEDLLHRIDEPVHKGLRFLHYASFSHDGDVLSLLLELAADPDVMDDVGFTPLHICAEKGYDDFIGVLIAYGARVRFTELREGDRPHGHPPRATAADEPLRLALRNYEHDTARLLLESGADPHAQYYLGQEINLVDPCDVEGVQLLLFYGADSNARDLHGMTPLMRACRSESEALETVHLLISHGADVNAETPEEFKTPLHYAVLAGRLGVSRALIERGARVRFPALGVRPPPLHYATLRGDVRLLELLLDSGADVDAATTAVGTALHLALTENVDQQVRVVSTLLRRGANPNSITATADGPLLKTPMGEYLQNCEHPRLDLLRLLLRYGARIVFQVQRNHPLGILKVIHRIHLGLNPEVMFLLAEASESTDVSFVELSKQLSQDHKDILLQKALQPFTLLHAARLQLRKSLGWGPQFLSDVQNMQIPQFLKKYVLFEEDV